MANAHTIYRKMGPGSGHMPGTRISPGSGHCCDAKNYKAKKVEYFIPVVLVHVVFFCTFCSDHLFLLDREIMALLAIGLGVLIGKLFGRNQEPQRIIEYRNDPATVALLERQQTLISQLEERLAAAVAEARQRNDPKYFRQAQNEVVQDFLGMLKDRRFKLTEALPSQAIGKFNALMMGDISTGKTMLLNKLFSLSNSTGVGDCTEGVGIATYGPKFVVWDSAGINRDLMIYDPDTLNFIHSVNMVVITYDSALMTAQAVIQVVNAIKGTGGFVCVRTKCDRWTPRDRFTIDEEMARDLEFLDRIGINSSEVRFFKTAAEGANEFDNKELLKLMRNNA